MYGYITSFDCTFHFRSPGKLLCSFSCLFESSFPSVPPKKKNFSVLCEKFLILHELLYSGFFVLIKLSCTTQKKTQRDIIKFLECKFHSEWIFKFRSAHVCPPGGAGVEMHTSMWIFYSNKMTNVMIKSSKLLRKVLDGGETYSENLKQHFSFPAQLQLLAREFWRFLLSQRTIHFSPASPRVYVGVQYASLSWCSEDFL